MKIQFCCDSFEWHVYDAGRKGIAFLPKEFEDTYHFVIQGRSHDEGGEVEGRIIESSAIHFCPSCGKNLDEFIQENRNAIIELAEKYKYLVKE